MLLLLIWSVVLIAVVALYLRQVYSRLSSHGVKCLSQIIPLFGNMGKIIFRMENFIEGVDEVYKKYPNERFVGRYEFIKPTIIVQDLDLVKKVTIKDFEHFLDHRSFIDEKMEPFFAKNLVSLKGQEWKDMRSTLSPAFTSSKIKLMVPFMEEVGEQMVRALKRKINDSGSDSIEVDVKDLTSRYTNDVIASCAFGLKVDSYVDENNQFYQMGKIASGLNFRQMMIFFFSSAFPTLAYILKLKVFSDATTKFFVDLVKDTMKDREVRQIIRHDMIHLLMEAKKGQLSHDEKAGGDNQRDTGFATVEESSIGKKSVDRVWSDHELIAQAVLFFIAGFETISIAMSFTLHELALQPEVQERLYQEIKEHKDRNGGKVDFNSIQQMKYLDMVTSEALRLWPPFPILDRVCVKDYNLGKPYPAAPKDYIMRKGDNLSIPVWSFHRDPKIFPNPEYFDPERFSEDNKQKINPMTYIPFGIGPRNCIGSRFALCELKVIICQIISHMELSPSKNTCIPAKLAPETFNPRLRSGHWLQFKAR